MELTTDLEIIATEAKRRADDYEAFGYYVGLQEMTDTALDEMVKQIAEPIAAAIDCTECANCCKNLNVYLTPSDVERLSQVIPLDDLLSYDEAQNQDEWACFTTKPCPLLNGKLCSVYEHRPETCRTYPVFTPDFRWTIHDILGGVGWCPIIYNVIEQLQQKLDW